MEEQKLKNIFFGIIIFGILLVGTIFFIMDEQLKQIVLIVLIIVAFIYLLFSANIILRLKDYERAVIFRFGRVNRVGGPGWTLVLPFVEKYSYVTLRTQVVDVPVQQIITKDNIKVTIDAILFLSIENTKESIINSVVKVEDYKKAASYFVIAMLRDILGEFVLTDVISNTESINKKITEEIKNVAKEWGIKVNSVEIKDLQIPDEIVESMHKQKAAVQKKLAIFEEAESEKAKINAIREATEGLSDKTILYYYIKALEKVGEGQSSKIIFPMELTSLLQNISEKINSGNPKINAKERKELTEYLPVIQSYLEKNEKKKRK
ncbi:MAG TPA: SPFH domain-containing protein [archaeon]|jgi:regulator of protease activity HflC (stomatin/prohibitin superfamily)|nr:SPFH domain-containing protein [archaeon]HPV66046.1 SPFH domain-containing protein [archaeon]